MWGDEMSKERRTERNGAQRSEEKANSVVRK